MNSGSKVVPCGVVTLIDAGDRVGAVEDAVGAAKDFDLVDGGAGEIAEIECAADVIGGNAVDEELVEVGLAAADVERGGTAALAGCRDLQPGLKAEGVGDVELVLIFEVGMIDDADGGADLRIERGSSGGGDDDLLAEGADAKVDVDVGRLVGADVDKFGSLGIEAGGFDADSVATAVGRLELIGSVGGRKWSRRGFCFRGLLG